MSKSPDIVVFMRRAEESDVEIVHHSPFLQAMSTDPWRVSLRAYLPTFVARSARLILPGLEQ
jgi:hypothetical protein